MNNNYENLKISPLSYRDFLVNKVEEGFSSRQLYYNPNSNDSLDGNYEFYYTIIPDLERIDNQAKAFSKFVVSRRGYFSKFQRTTWDLEEPRSNLEEAYKYSYLKMLYFISKTYTGEQAFTYNGSKLFYGHKMCLDIFRQRSVNSKNYSNNSNVARHLRWNDKIDEILKDVDMYKDIISGNGVIDKHELTLDLIDNIYSDITLCDANKNLIIISEICPLGNLCFGDDKSYFKYIPSQKNYLNYTSMYWNSANCITITEERRIDDYNSVYRIGETKAISQSVTYDFEVFSITGTDGLIDMTRYPRGPKRQMPNPGNGGSNPGSNSPLSPDGKRKSKSNGNKNKPNSGGGSFIYKDNAAFISKEKQLNNKSIPFIDDNSVSFKVVDGRTKVLSENPDINNKFIDKSLDYLANNLKIVDKKYKEILQKFDNIEKQTNYAVNQVGIILDKINRGGILTKIDVLVLQEVTQTKIIDIFAINSDVLVYA
jgi:hypothetical protein